MKKCPNCEELLGDNAEKCFKCRYDFNLKRVITQDELKQKREKEQELINKKIEEEKKRNQKNAELLEFQKNFKMTTGYNFEGYDIIDYKNIISREIVVGTGVFSELDAGISDLLGMRASGYEGKIAEAKLAALNYLKNDAAKLNANAIIGIDYDITTIGNNMIIVSANGTAVEIRKKTD